MACLVRWQIDSRMAWISTRQFSAKCWQLEKGSIKTVGGCDKSDQVDIVTRQKYRNFELELEWRWRLRNSGIIYLISEDHDQTWKTGPEMQVLDDDKHPDGKKPSTSAGSLFDLIAPGSKTLRPIGEYNKARVVIKNGHVEHWLNGGKILEYDLGSAAFKELTLKVSQGVSAIRAQFRRLDRVAISRGRCGIARLESEAGN